MYLSSLICQSDSLKTLRDPKISPTLDCTSKFVVAALVIAAFAALTFAILGTLGIFGSIGSVGFISSIAAGCGGASFLSATGILYIVLKACCKRAAKKVTTQRAKNTETPTIPETQKPSLTPSRRGQQLSAPHLQQFNDLKKLEQEDLLEKFFWEMHFSVRELHALLEMSINSGIEDPKKYAQFIVDHFDQYINLNEPLYSLTAQHKEVLIQSFEKQLTPPRLTSSDDVNARRQGLSLPNGRMLCTFSTLGDGTCGLHALLGQLENGIYQADPAAVRKLFCDQLRERRQNGTLPVNIVNVLQCYFHEFNLAPTGFREKAKARYDKHRENYENLPREEQDKRIEGFLNDDVVFDAYLENLQKIGTYLLQDELEAAAICFDKQVILYQPGWGNDGGKVASDILNAQGKENIVHIWYNGFNHYERAEVVTKQ